MARNANEEERSYFNIGEEWEVSGVRVLEFGTLFTLKVGGLTLYDMRYIPAGKNAKGKRYNAFVAPPERKGTDGKYYKLYNIFLSEADIKDIVEAVEALLVAMEEEEEEKPRKRK